MQEFKNNKSPKAFERFLSIYWECRDYLLLTIEDIDSPFRSLRCGKEAALGGLKNAILR